MIIQVLPYEYCIAQIPDFSQVDFAAEMQFLAKTDEEYSVVCRKADQPGNTFSSSGDWRALRIKGPLDLALTGILADLASHLAKEDIAVFAISTYLTDYLLVRTSNLLLAIRVLRMAGNHLTGHLPNLAVRRFQPSDAEKLSALIGRNFLEVNSKDYPNTEIERLVTIYSPQKVAAMAIDGKTYVVCSGSEVIGCGTISEQAENLKTCVLQGIFVDPDYHGFGIGRLVVEALENDEIFLTAATAILDASITASEFYVKLGYHYADGNKRLDEHGLYRMQKMMP